MKNMFGMKQGILALFVAMFLLAGCGDSATSTTGTAASTAASASTATPSTINIDLINFQFSPLTVSIPAGTTVIWTNKEAAKHTVTADDGSFDSGTMEKGATFSHKFDKPGTVGYFCKFHGSAGQGMAAKLVVTDAANTNTNVAAVPSVAATTAPVAVATTAPAAIATTAPAAADTSMAGMTMTADTPAASATSPAANAGQAAGTLNVRDNLQLSDQAILNITTIAAAPQGHVYFAWLVNSVSGAVASMGQLTPDASNAVSLRFSTPQQTNILANYDKIIVTTETLDPTPSAPSASVVYSGQLPGQALIHIRHLLVSFPTTPGKIGLEVGLRGQLQELRRHAEFLRDAEAGNDFGAVKLHAEHIVNLIEGSEGADYGDLNHDGKITNPGDGFGLIKNGDHIGYLDGSKQHAALAANAPDATADIKLHAGHVGITVDNVTGWVSTIRDRALAIAKAGAIGDTKAAAAEILVLANQAINGVDLKGDGQILPIPGSGGGLTSYQHSQLMAAIPLQAGGTPVANATPQAQATAIPATQAAPAAAGEVHIDIAAFKFGTGPITVKVGTKVTWTNQDSAAHTATADSGTWDSGTLQKGQSFSFTFNKPGLVKYYCAIHGGPGGQGMSSTITVVQ